MTTVKTALLATAAVFAFGTAVQAADPIAPLPVTPVSPVASGYDWTGFYAGINAGFGSGEAYDDDGVIDAFDDDLDSVSGFLGGVQAGANFQAGMFVLGVEGDIQLSTLSQETEAAGADVTVNLDYFGTVRARAGVGFDNVLPYVTGGLAYGGVTAESDDLDDSVSNNHWGWTIGGGVDVGFDESTSFRVEYLYTDLGTQEYETVLGDFDAGLRFHTVRAGVNFHF